MGNLHRLQGRLFPHSDTGTVQEILEISCPGPDLPIQSSTVWPVHSAHGVHCHSQGGKSTVRATSHRECLQHMQVSRLNGEHRKVGAGAKANFQFCWLPVRPPVWSGPTDTGLVAEFTRENTGTPCPPDVFDEGVHVLDRPVNSHRKAGSPRQVTHEAHSMASQKQLEDSGVLRKEDSSTQIFTPPPTMVAKGKQCSHQPTITPNMTCSASLYRHIKRRVGLSIKRVHCQGNLVPTRKQATHKLSGTQGSVSGLKRVSRSMRGQDGSYSN